MPRRIHVTERSAFRSCRRYWHYRNNLGIEPKKGSIPLQFGTAIHEVLAKYYLARFETGSYPNLPQVLEFWDKAYVKDEFPDLTEDDRRLGIAMLEGYYAWAQTWDSHLEILTIDGKPAIEVQLQSHPLTPGGDVLVGTMDLIVFDRRTGRNWVIDHKNYKSFVNDSALEVDDQITSYLWLCQDNGIQVEGLILNQLRKKIPEIPPQLVRGGLSKAKNIDTTKSQYLKAIEMYNLKESDYYDILRCLEENTFFRRSRITRSRAELRSFGHYLPMEVGEMVNPNLPLYPNWQESCSWCSMRSLCLTETEEGDFESVKQGLYQTVVLRD